MHSRKIRTSPLLIIMSLLLLVLTLSSCSETGNVPATTEATSVTSLPEDTTLPVSLLTSTAQPLPDLVVESISIDWEILEDCFDYPDNAIYQVQIQIVNNGEADAGPFRIDIAGYGDDIFSTGLKTGEKLNLEFEWIDLELEVGETVAVSVDENDKVLESDEGNNKLRREILVPAAVASCSPTPEPTPCPEPVPIPLLPPDQQVNITSLHMINPTSGWAVAGPINGDEHILRTIDGGRTWRDVTPPQTTLNCGNYPLRATGYFLNVEVAWITYYEPVHGRGPFGVWRTLDGGETWELSSFLQRNTDTFGGLFTWPILEFIDSRHGWVLIDYFLGAGSHEAELFRSVDGGRSWELIPDVYLTHGSGLDMIDTTHGWETSNHPIVVYMGLSVTDDGGRTWEFQELPYPNELLDVEEYNPLECSVSSPRLASSQQGTVVVQCESDYFIYSSADGGQTWDGKSIPGGPPEFISPLIGWAIEAPGSDDIDVNETKQLHLYQTENGGQTWREVTSVDWFGQLSFVSERVGWALVESGDKVVIMHTTDSGETWEELIPRTLSYEVTSSIDVTPQLFIPSELQTIESGNVTELHVIAEVPAENATRLGFHPNGGSVYITHEDGTLTRWIIDGISGSSIARIHTDWIYDLDFSLGSYWIATASKDGTLKLEGLYSYQGILTNDIQTLQMDDREVTCVAFSPDGSALAVGNDDQTILVFQFSVWGLDTELSSSLKRHTGWVWDVAFSTDGMTLASASSDRTVRLWDRESEEEKYVLRGHTSTVQRVAFSPDGRILVSASWDGTLKLWDVLTGQELHTLREHDGWVNDVAFSPDGKLIASASADGFVILWDPDDGEVIYILPDHGSDVRALAFSPDGRMLATVSEEGKLRFWGVTP